ncbi:transglutaminase-like domain-containing protein [Methanoplanus endosymbiosus]|uniref:Transglutaminase-like domain-containing protein n=1 Tax=Methanoplanus endosymbiosus TaxID=33865 RepID=A0A9E7PMM1_9EURY|nr:transglutaminase-like domain-containing protein [Methanoplanus endosymbiosus]UUX93019.1 transglutaminase-like domain-containing protein [Methanoplanus endosymbiosus]
MKFLGLIPALMITLLLAIACAGCMESSDGQMKETPAPASSADDIFLQAETAMAGGNYRTAASLYEDAFALYQEKGDSDHALPARNGMFRAMRATEGFPYNRTTAEAVMRETTPTLTVDETDTWLDERAQTITSDGETLYFEDVAQNYFYADSEKLSLSDNRYDFRYATRYAIPADGTSAGNSTTPYVNPVRYTGTEALDLPADVLPETGVISIWYPLPLETASQRDVVVTNISHKEYIITGPVTEGEIAYVYYEIPANEIGENLTITIDIAFTSYERKFEVDPAKIGTYDTTDPEYILYTSSGRNIAVTDEIRDLAMAIVGNETNPYLQAQALCLYVIDTYPYNHVPHISLDTVVPKVPESSYMLKTGHGDCGTQGMLFSALCRSLGIPARSTGGYTMTSGAIPSCHFWAEYYIEDYGWIPCDITFAKSVDKFDIGEDDRETFRTYYTNGLDPTRIIIQKDVDAPMDPSIPADAVVFRAALQSPAIICDTAEDDLDLIAEDHFSITLNEEY